jgi:hypothetical protein
MSAFWHLTTLCAHWLTVECESDRVDCVPQDGDAYREQRIKLGGLAEHLETIRSGRRVVFVACGTSYHASLAARCALPAP